jgi:quercetin dioxygenase-like cupin family protein
MRITKKTNESITKEEAHGGSGSRKLYISENEIDNIQGTTYGWMPIGQKYAWHKHVGLDEIMPVIKSEGIVRDSDGKYPYKNGDLFIFPNNIEHEIENTSDFENEFVFIRVRV